jgi:hypothetical protein
VRPLAAAAWRPFSRWIIRSGVTTGESRRAGNEAVGGIALFNPPATAKEIEKSSPAESAQSEQLLRIPHPASRPPAIPADRPR